MSKSEEYFNEKELSGMAVVFMEDLETMNHKTLEDVEELIAPEIMELEDELNAVGLDDGKYAVCERLLKLFDELKALKL